MTNIYNNKPYLKPLVLCVVTFLSMTANADNLKADPQTVTQEIRLCRDSNCKEYALLQYDGTTLKITNGLGNNADLSVKGKIEASENANFKKGISAENANFSQITSTGSITAKGSSSFENVTFNGWTTFLMDANFIKSAFFQQDAFFAESARFATNWSKKIITIILGEQR